MKTLDCHESHAWIETKGLLDISPSTKVILSSLIDRDFFGKIIPVVTEKYDFEYRDKTILLIFFLIFPTIGIMIEGI